MKAKEKATELVEKYLNTIIHFPYIDSEDGNCIGTGYMTHISAVRCALSLVEEMIKEHTWKTSTAFENAQLKKWEDVKSELDALYGCL